MGQNLRYLFGVDYPPKVVYFKGFWDVHQGTRVLTHRQLLLVFVDLVMGQKDATLGVHRCWSIFPLPIRLFGCLFLTHSQFWPPFNGTFIGWVFSRMFYAW